MCKFHPLYDHWQKYQSVIEVGVRDILNDKKKEEKWHCMFSDTFHTEAIQITHNKHTSFGTGMLQFENVLV